MDHAIDEWSFVPDSFRTLEDALAAEFSTIRCIARDLSTIPVTVVRAVALSCRKCCHPIGQ